MRYKTKLLTLKYFFRQIIGDAFLAYICKKTAILLPLVKLIDAIFYAFYINYINILF